jgi:hypothetical protein
MQHALRQRRLAQVNAWAQFAPAQLQELELHPRRGQVRTGFAEGFRESRLEKADPRAVVGRGVHSSHPGFRAKPI